MALVRTTPARYLSCTLNMRTRSLEVALFALPLWCLACGNDPGPAGEAAGGANSGAGSKLADAAGTSSALAGSNGVSGSGGVVAQGGSAVAGTASNAGGGGQGTIGGSDTGSGGAAGNASTGGAAAGSNAGGQGSTDRAAFFGASRCAAAQVQLCEDFESGSLNTSIWKVEGDTPVVDSLQAARGTKALHIKKNGSGSSKIRETKTFPEAGGKYWGRAFFYFNSLPQNVGLTYSHYTFIAGEGTGVAGEVRLGGVMRARFGQPPKNYFAVGTDNRSSNGTGDWANADNDPPDSPKTIPEKQWLCIEWLHDSGADQTRVFWDGVEHPSLGTTPQVVHGGKMPGNLFYLPDFTSVWLGWDEYQATNQTFELWIDEIAVDDKQVGCTR